MAISRICSVEECVKPMSSRGWCKLHYSRWRSREGSIVGKPGGKNYGSCSVENCKKSAKVMGFCRSHHHRFKRYGDPEGGASYYNGDQKRWLMAHVNFTGEGCLMWPFYVEGNGYGHSVINGVRGAHRVMCGMAHGKPPTPEHDAAHSCNVKACVNPAHIRWATRSENMFDKIAHGTAPLGERNPAHKLTEIDVLSIRALNGVVLLREAAEQFSVSISTIHLIWKGKSWKWL